MEKTHVFAFPLRIPSPVDFVGAFGKISSNKFDREMANKLTNARDGVIRANTETMFEKSSGYLGLLMGLIEGVNSSENAPLLKAQESKLQFAVSYKWNTSLLKKETIEKANSQLELYCVVYNMAVTHLQSIGKKHQDNITVFLEAAGIFEYLEGINEINEGDISPEISSILKSICLALAEESLCFMCLENDEKHESMAKVMRDAWSKYDAMAKDVEMFPDLSLFVQFKRDWCEMLSILFSSIYYNKKDENGNCLALLAYLKKQSIRLKESSLKYKKVSEEMKWFNEKLEYYTIKYQKQNDLVYHHKIPDQLPDILSAKKFGKIKPFSMVPISSDWTSDVYNKFNCEKIETEPVKPHAIQTETKESSKEGSSDSKENEKDKEPKDRSCKCEIQ